MAENPFGNPVVPDVMRQAESPEGVTGLVQQGQAIQQMRDSRGFGTAISVQRPRVLVAVEAAVKAEARLLGKEAFYAWQVKNKKTGRKELIEGTSIGGAMVLLNNWGNSVIDSLPIQDLGDAYVFTAACIDLERGVTVVRPFRMAKGRSAVSQSYDDDRASDMRFGIAASKAARNAILQMIPTWLQTVLMETAKEGVRKKLEGYIVRNGLAAAQDYAITEFGKFGVTPEAICAKHGRAEVPGLTIDDLTLLQGDLAALHNGAERPESLFPPAEGEKPSIDALRDELTKASPEANGKPDNAKLEKVMGRKRKAQPEAASADAKVTALRAACMTAWEGVPEEDRSKVLANVQLMKVGAIEDITDEKVLRQIQSAFVDANRTKI